MDRTQLHELPQIHHGNLVTDLANYCKVVTDKELGQVKLVLEFSEKVEDLGLNRYVE